MAGTLADGHRELVERILPWAEADDNVRAIAVSLRGMAPPDLAAGTHTGDG